MADEPEVEQVDEEPAPVTHHVLEVQDGVLGQHAEFVPDREES
jgi:hypothetical protein